MVSILLIGLLLACYSCVEIGDSKSGNKGVILHAFDQDLYLGVANLQNKSYKNLKVTGTLNADNLIVSGTTKVVGDAIMVDSNIRDLNIVGKARLTNLVVSRNLKIVGKGKINTGSYREMDLHGKSFELYNLTTGSIIIKNDSNKAKTAQIVLYNCKVTGDIICLAPNCNLLIDKSTQISGKIIGFANIENK